MRAEGTAERAVAHPGGTIPGAVASTRMTVPASGAAPSVWPFVCTNCGRHAPAGPLTYRCPTCGGVYDLDAPMPYQPTSALSDLRGLARFRLSLPLSKDDPWITLGEGGTPLIIGQVDGRTVHFKGEHLNPTGSFKDRGASVLVSALAGAGVVEAIEDSSGNAGAAFAAYAARAGIRARVYVPDSASPRKRAQIAAYGAELVRQLGPRSQVAAAVRREADAGAVYASHVWLPFGLAGFATVAFELAEQLGRAPGAVVLPAGHGTLLLGLARGFQAMRQAGAIDHVPKLIAAQAAACAPLWAAYQAGGQAVGWVQEGPTRAEGIRILQPLRGDAVLQAIESTHGTVVAVDEPTITRGETELARQGFFVEPTSAVVWGALEATLRSLPDPVVAVLTGSGLKSEPALES